MSSGNPGDGWLQTTSRRKQDSHLGLTWSKGGVGAGPSGGCGQAQGGLTLRFLPFQFDKYAPKLDGPYFRHSNVSVSLWSPGWPVG